MEAGQRVIWGVKELPSLLIDVNNDSRYDFLTAMIKSFADQETRKFWETGRSRRLPANFASVAKRKLAQLDAVTRLSDLALPPGNRLEALRGDRKGQHSIRINDKYRVCFLWIESDAHEVEITDYH